MPHFRRNNAGDYDTLVDLRRRTLAPNDSGERVPSWPLSASYATVWAKRLDVHGNKRFIAQSTGTDQLVEFTVRWRGDMLATDHIFIVEDGSEHEVMQIANVGRREEHNILSRRLVA